MTRPLLHAVIFLLVCLPGTALAVEQYGVRVVAKKAQPRENFVQGLEILDGYLYVSSGRYGKSRLLRYRFDDGSLNTARKIGSRMFAEGVTVFGDRVYQLTWHNRIMLVYNKADLKADHWFRIPGEGWGLTHNGKELIYSDGSEYLHFVSPETEKILRSLQVTENDEPLRRLNELEWINGEIWANVWQTQRIVIINPANGKVRASINCKGLLPADEYHTGTGVLNGIARNPDDGSIWVTGKNWPWIYHIEPVPVTDTGKQEHAGANSR